MTASATQSAPDTRLALRRLIVVAVEDLTPGMRRIVLAGEDLADLDVPGRALGPYIKLLFGRHPDVVWPHVGEDGRLVWPRLGSRPAMRTYSIRSFDRARREIAIDVLLHPGGIAADWARAAQPGASVMTWGPGIPGPAAADFLVMAADHCALPALAFILENLPAGTRGHAFIEVPRGEEQPLRSASAVEITWLRRDSVATASALPDAVRQVRIPPSADALVWAGAEAAIARAIRRHARDHLPGDSVHVLNYWKSGVSECAFDYCR